MGQIWVRLLTDRVVGQTDLLALFSEYLSKHMIVILAGIFIIVILALMLGKKMTTNPSAKRPVSKNQSKQSQYKRYK
ncbi:MULTISPECIES: hypothetical protein [unclassified Enterococcus]|uniref:hypothetical protein n=1 Tax=unclassified Enterococcus TaxID=2608891 RepID=UPI0013EDCE1C|nr:MULTISPECIES: hypothetical protein [unclassified Enterococcus]